MSEENKGAAARWVDALAALLLWKNKTRGGERGIWEGDSLQSARMLYMPKAEISGSALINPVGVKPYYCAVKCQKAFCFPQRGCVWFSR